ncbi:hypothetical protein BDV26DRAFT_290584 [Aspergillus bertholletiae]|uniref:Uncharacterized protein n=1 Tax=Aspergillus bertholletiae TaxID=1226010 RepID=A0A5N7BEP2_9EURO|nr:hypothetical protein BDV26DRAFT_290584 [Aspergillus bertholletiae]
MGTAGFLRTWFVWGFFIVLGLCLQPSNSESPADNLTTYSNNGLKTLMIRVPGEHPPVYEWLDRSTRFLSLGEDFALVDDATTSYTGNNDPADNYGHVAGWPYSRTRIRFRCACTRLRVKAVETAWLNIIKLLEDLPPILVRLQPHYENPNERRPSQKDKNRMKLLGYLYPGQSFPQIKNEVEKMVTDIHRALTGDWYSAHIWCTDKEWILQQEYTRRRWPQCSGSNALRSQRSNLYENGPGIPELWRNKHDQWVSYLANREDHCKSFEIKPIHIFPDPHAISGGDYITFCRRTFTANWKFHFADIRQIVHDRQLTGSVVLPDLASITQQTPEGDILAAFATSESIHGQRKSWDQAFRFSKTVVGDCYWGEPDVTCYEDHRADYYGSFDGNASRARQPPPAGNNPLRP